MRVCLCKYVLILCLMCGLRFDIRLMIRFLRLIAFVCMESLRF